MIKNGAFLSSIERKEVSVRMNDRDLAQVEQNPPFKLKKRNAKMKKLSY